MEVRETDGSHSLLSKSLGLAGVQRVGRPLGRVANLFFETGQHELSSSSGALKLEQQVVGGQRPLGEKAHPQ